VASRAEWPKGVAGVEPVSLIVAALISGAAAGGKAAVTEGVKDAYAGLKALVTRRFAERPSAQAALAEIETQAAEQGGEQVDASCRTVLEGEIVRAVVTVAVVVAATVLVTLATMAPRTQAGLDPM